MVWSADSSHILSLGPGSFDLWDASNLAQEGTLHVGQADQGATVYIPDEGTTFEVMQASGPIYTWDVRPQHVLDVACDAAGRNLTTKPVSRRQTDLRRDRPRPWSSPRDRVPQTR